MIILNNLFRLPNTIRQGPNYLVRMASNSHSIKVRRRELDPDLWKQRPFVIVDPSDPEEILYLRESEFHQYQRVSLSNGINLTIIARDTTPAAEIGPVADNTDKQQTAQSTTSSSHLKKSPPILGLIGTLFKVRGDDSLVELSDKNIRSLYFKYIVKLYFWTFGKHSVSRHRVALDFVRSIQRIHKHQGSMGVILRMKVSLIALNAFVGGCPLSSTHPLGTYVALSGGIPKWIPRPVRTLIRQRDLRIIRVWSSIFNTYKGLKGTWVVPSLKDVLATPVPDIVFGDLEVFSRMFWSIQKWVPHKLLFEAEEYVHSSSDEGYPYLVSPKAGPNNSPAYSGWSVLFDSIAWMLHPKGPFCHILQMIEFFPTSYLINQVEANKEFVESSLPIPLDHFEDQLEYLYTDVEAPLNQKKLRSLPRSVVKAKAFDAASFLLQHSPYRGMTDEPRLYKTLYSCKGYRNLADGDKRQELKLALTSHFPELVCLGRIHNIQEAAGKNRIIAINDFWTQQVLRPLHLWLFDVCKHLPQDSTFDQEGSLARFVQRGDIKEYFSYDLSAATDMIPVGMYKAVLSPLIGADRSQAWIDLLTDKDFVVPFKAVDGSGNRVKKVRYTRGQPMGALSSWGLLNLAHHVVVQYARLYSVVKDIVSFRDKSKYWPLIPSDQMVIRSVLLDGKISSGEDWNHLWKGFIALVSEASFIKDILPFDKYVVLGDDVVIGDREVAEAYYEIMTKHYGVGIKLAKSYVSSSLVNFANQTFLDKVNISPIPFKELLSSNGLASRFEFASRVVRRWFSATSAIQYLRLVLRNSWYQRLKFALGVGKVFRPILPVLFALTLVNAPIQGMNTFTDDQQGVEDRFCAVGALMGDPDALYKTVLNSFNLSKIWKGLFGEEFKDSKRLKSYLLFLIKDLVQPYLGNLDKIDPNPDRAELSKASARGWDGLDEAPVIESKVGNSYDSIWMETAFRRYELSVQKLDPLILKLQNWESLSTVELASILTILLDEPEIVRIVQDAYKGWCYSTSEYIHEQTYYRIIETADESSRQSKRAILQRKEQLISRLIQTTIKYIDLGGLLVEETEDETSVNQAHLGSRELGEAQTITLLSDSTEREQSLLFEVEDRTEDPAR